MKISCSWCHEPNDDQSKTWPSCHNCQHRADVPRIECDCPACDAVRGTLGSTAAFVQAGFAEKPRPSSLEDWIQTLLNIVRTERKRIYDWVAIQEGGGKWELGRMSQAEAEEVVSKNHDMVYVDRDDKVIFYRGRGLHHG